MKRVCDSYAEQVQILTQSNLNGYNRLFGGQLMEWIDIVAAVVARRHSGCNVTTAVVDLLEFKEPAYANDTVIISGKITYAGKTSMEIKVETFIEELCGRKKLINTAYVVMVAIDENGKPVKVPELEIVTDEEKHEYEEALLRRKRREEYKRATTL